MLANQDTEVQMNENKSNCTVPFKPPASICGIACVLLPLEGTVKPDKVLTCSCGPGLAVQTLWVRSVRAISLLHMIFYAWIST